MSFLTSPQAGLDGVEIMRVGRQTAERGPALFDQRADLGGLVRLQVVEEHDVAAAQAGPSRSRTNPNRCLLCGSAMGHA